MTAATPEEAAYEAHRKSLAGVVDVSWVRLPWQEQAAWEAAAQAAIENDPTALARDALRLAAQRDEARAVVRAVYALCRDTDGNWLSPEDNVPAGEFQAALNLLGCDPDSDEWRQRAGIEATP